MGMLSIARRYILKVIDQTAYASAAHYSGYYVVTLSVDKVLFKQPIYLDELVTCYAMINYVGRTSMEVGIKVVADNLTTGEKRRTNSCYVAMVTVDTNLKPVAVRPLTINDEIEQRRFDEAKMTREARIQLAKAYEKRKNK